MTNQYEFEGKTVDDAVADGLIRLGLSRDQVDIEVLHKGSRGIFGIGSEPARVRLMPRSVTLAQSTVADAEPEIADEEETSQTTAASPQAPSASAPTDVPDAAQASPAESETLVEHTEADDADHPDPSPVSATDETESTGADDDADDGAPAAGEDDEDAAPQADLYDEISDDELRELAADMLGQMIHLMGFEVEIQAYWKDPEAGDQEPCLMLDVEGEDLGSLIGRRGETLANMQYLLRLMINQKIHEWRNIVIDVAHYKERRAEQLNSLALRMAEQVVESGRALTLEPMPSNERRIVHMALRDHPDVYTQSTGESERRKVNIIPKQPDAA